MKLEKKTKTEPKHLKCVTPKVTTQPKVSIECMLI